MMKQQMTHKAIMTRQAHGPNKKLFAIVGACPLSDVSLKIIMYKYCIGHPL